MKYFNTDNLLCFHLNLFNNIEYVDASVDYDMFCKNNKDILNEEIKSLCKNGLTDSTEIKNKIKKTYKNRHFLIVSK